MSQNKWNKVQSSGKKEENFDGGSVRDSREGKGRYDLMSPITLRRLALHFEYGAKRYNSRNWERGQPISRYLDSALRHMYNYLEGGKKEDHLAAAMWNIHCIIHTEEMVEHGKLPLKLCDLPFHKENQSTKPKIPQTTPLIMLDTEKIPSYQDGVGVYVKSKIPNHLTVKHVTDIKDL